MDWRWRYIEQLLELLVSDPRQAVHLSTALGLKGMIQDVVQALASIGYPPMVQVGEWDVNLLGVLEELERHAA